MFQGRDNQEETWRSPGSEELKTLQKKGVKFIRAGSRVWGKGRGKAHGFHQENLVLLFG